MPNEKFVSAVKPRSALTGLLSPLVVTTHKHFGPRYRQCGAKALQSLLSSTFVVVLLHFICVFFVCFSVNHEDFLKGAELLWNF